MLLKTNPITSEYDLKEEIGKGSFSVVRRGVSRSNRQEYAVKIIDKAKRDCVEEIEILLRYGQHNNIISLRDMFESAEQVNRDFTPLYRVSNLLWTLFGSILIRLLPSRFG